MTIRFIGEECEIPIDFIGMYSDGTPIVKHDEWDKIVKSKTVVVQPRDLQEFVLAMSLTASVRAAGGGIEKLILPYLPGARQDRINPTGDGKFIKEYTFDEIRTNAGF